MMKSCSEEEPTILHRLLHRSSSNRCREMHFTTNSTGIDVGTALVDLAQKSYEIGTLFLIMTTFSATARIISEPQFGRKWRMKEEES